MEPSQTKQNALTHPLKTKAMLRSTKFTKKRNVRFIFVYIKRTILKDNLRQRTYRTPYLKRDNTGMSIDPIVLEPISKYTIVISTIL